jgi:PII-like signaling protein
MVTDGVIEVQDTTVVKQTRKPAVAAGPPEHVRQKGPAVLLRVFLGAADRWHDEPLEEAILKRLRLMEIAGATVYRGVLGYGAKGHEHRRTLLHPTRDLPVVIEVVDTAEKIQAAAAAIEDMLEDGLLMTCPVEMTRLIRKAGTPPA